MKILLQTNNRKHSQLEHEYEKLTESGFEIVPFGYLSKGTVEFTGLEDVLETENTLLRVCIPVIRKVFTQEVKTNRPDILKTVQYDANAFRLSTQPESTHLLNKSPRHFLNTFVLDVLDKRFVFDQFVKPNDDLKLFSGTIIPAGKTLREVLEEKNELNPVLEQIVAPVVLSSNILELVEEVRCYVVNRKVITISRYKKEHKGDITELSPADYNAYSEYAQSMVDTLYAPCDNFTIDIARTNNDCLKVIEYNCLTSSGLYNCNTKDLFTALQSYYYPNH